MWQPEDAGCRVIWTQRMGGILDHMKKFLWELTEYAITDFRIDICFKLGQVLCSSLCIHIVDTGINTSANIHRFAWQDLWLLSANRQLLLLRSKWSTVNDKTKLICVPHVSQSSSENGRRYKRTIFEEKCQSKLFIKY